MSIKKIDKDKIEIDVTVCTATVQTLPMLIRYIVVGSSFFSMDHLRNMLTRFIPSVMSLILNSK